MRKHFGLLFALIVSLSAQAQEGKLVIYSSYDAARLAPILAPFTQRTGIAVEVVNAASTALIQQLEAEGAQSPADLYLDKDIVYMGEAGDKDLLQPFASSEVESKIPSHLIAKDRNWFLIFYRARTIMYNTNLVTPSEITSYADLGDKKWEGRVCVRTSNNSYNEGMAGYFVKHLGLEKAVSLFKSWVQNFAVEPLKGDREVIGAIAAGTCAVGVANTYYLAPMVRDDASFPVRAVFVEQQGVGAHINGVGIGITKSSKNVAGATLFLEFMASKEVQEIVAEGFSQYPSNREAGISSVLKTEFGPFVEDTTNVGEIAAHIRDGKKAMQEADYK